jgi:hypothetical protein
MENTKIEFKGTKGDWILEKPFKLQGNVLIDIVSEITKCDSCNNTEIGYLIARTFKNAVEEKEQIPNSQLIANAPSMFEMLKKAKARICSLKLSMLTNPYHESGSEFDDQTKSSQELEDEIEQLLIKATKLD